MSFRIIANLYYNNDTQNITKKVENVYICDQYCQKECVRINLAGSDISSSHDKACVVKVYPQVVSPTELSLICKEIMDANVLRQYKIQGVSEPRVHALLHQDATQNFEDQQPGYW